MRECRQVEGRLFLSFLLPPARLSPAFYSVTTPPSSTERSSICEPSFTLAPSRRKWLRQFFCWDARPVQPWPAGPVTASEGAWLSSLPAIRIWLSKAGSVTLGLTQG